MKLFTTYITAKRCLYILILLLLLIILSGVFNLFSPQVILIFNIILLITVLILFVVFPEEEKTRAGSVQEKNRKEYTHFNSEDNEMALNHCRSNPIYGLAFGHDGKCIYVNKKWIEFTGISYQESRGFGFIKTMAIPENHHRRQEWWKMIKGHQPYEIKFRIKNASGELHWALAQANAYHINSVFMGYIGSIIDITEQENSTIAVQELSDRKDEFLSIASHELKTPLTSIKALFQLIERNITPDHKVYHFLGRANNNILRLETLIANLLDVSKINAGKLSYDYTEFAFQEMLGETILSMQNIAPNHHFILRNRIVQIYW